MGRTHQYKRLYFMAVSLSFWDSLAEFGIIIYRYNLGFYIYIYTFGDVFFKHF